MNYVAIDPSLSCTAMVVNDQKFVYTTSSVAHTKKGVLKRWFQECEDNGVTVRVWEDLPDFTSNSDTELSKLSRYDEISNHIVMDVLNNINTLDGVVLGIEGYSHSSKAGPLIDLVTISTLLRNKLYTQVPMKVAGQFNMMVLQPTEVKQRAAKLVYAPIQKGKKTEYRNSDGVAGGSFKKPEIYKALLDNQNLSNDTWVKYLHEQSEEILAMKMIPKPIEDINDAKTLYEIIKAS